MKALKHQIFTFGLLSLFLVQACKKDKDNPPSNPLTISISAVSNVTTNTASVSGTISNSENSGITASGFCYATSPNPTTSNTVVNLGTTSLSTVLSGLQSNTTYYVRAFATNSSGTTYSSQQSFTTIAFSINYVKQYGSTYASYYYNTKQVFSIESGVHTIYGKGFSSTGMTAKMVSRNNATDYITPSVTVVNDSILTFQVPANLLGQDPYVTSKEYYLLLNNTLFNSNYGFINNSTDTAIFVVTNKDINIASVTKITGTTCNTYVIQGQFASDNGNVGMTPGSLLGVPSKPASRRLIVKAGGALFNYYSVPNGNPTCGTASMLYEIYSSSLYRYHDAGQVQLKETLPTGGITFQVENTMPDGTLVYSNIYSFTN